MHNIYMYICIYICIHTYIIVIMIIIIIIIMIMIMIIPHPNSRPPPQIAPRSSIDLRVLASPQDLRTSAPQKARRTIESSGNGSEEGQSQGDGRRFALTPSRAHSACPCVYRERRGSQGMGVVSNNWSDLDLLPLRYMLKTSCWPMFKPPSLGPPWIPFSTV